MTPAGATLSASRMNILSEQKPLRTNLAFRLFPLLRYWCSTTSWISLSAFVDAPNKPLASSVPLFDGRILIEKCVCGLFCVIEDSHYRQCPNDQLINHIVQHLFCIERMQHMIHFGERWIHSQPITSLIGRTHSSRPALVFGCFEKKRRVAWFPI